MEGRRIDGGSAAWPPLEGPPFEEVFGSADSVRKLCECADPGDPVGRGSRCDCEYGKFTPNKRYSLYISAERGEVHDFPADLGTPEEMKKAIDIVTRLNLHVMQSRFAKGEYLNTHWKPMRAIRLQEFRAAGEKDWGDDVNQRLLLLRTYLPQEPNERAASIARFESCWRGMPADAAMEHHCVLSAEDDAGHADYFAPGLLKNVPVHHITAKPAHNRPNTSAPSGSAAAEAGRGFTEYVDVREWGSLAAAQRDRLHPSKPRRLDGDRTPTPWQQSAPTPPPVGPDGCRSPTKNEWEEVVEEARQEALAKAAEAAQLEQARAEAEADEAQLQAAMDSCRLATLAPAQNLHNEWALVRHVGPDGCPLHVKTACSVKFSVLLLHFLGEAFDTFLTPRVISIRSPEMLRPLLLGCICGALTDGFEVKGPPGAPPWNFRVRKYAAPAVLIERVFPRAEGHSLYNLIPSDAALEEASRCPFRHGKRQRITTL